MTFPLPNRDHVLAIKQGLLRYQEVAAEVESLLVEVGAAAERSGLPDDPDREWIDDFVAETYARQIKADGVVGDTSSINETIRIVQGHGAPEQGT